MTNTTGSSDSDEFDPTDPNSLYEEGRYVATLGVVNGLHDGDTAQFLGDDFDSREDVLDAISIPRGCIQTTICVEFERYDGNELERELPLGNGDGVILVNEETKEVHSLGTGFECSTDIEIAIHDPFYGVSEPEAPHRVCIACDAKRPAWAIDEALHLLRDEWMEHDQLTLGELLTKLSTERFGEMDVRHGDPEELRREDIVGQLTTDE